MRLLLAALARVARFTFWAGALGAALLLYFAQTLPSPQRLTLPPLPEPTEIQGADGQWVARLYRVHRVPVRWREVSPALLQALIAAEDRRFFAHRGIDARALLRSLWANLRAGRIVQGGSTITMQLARNAFLSQRRSIARKIREILLALALERKFTKWQILEAYLNLVYLGQGTHGVEAASQVYFGKSARELNPAEAALLVALLRGPGLYDPYRYPERARQRRNWVLRRMRDMGFLSEAEYSRWREVPLGIQPARSRFFGGTEAPYFVADLMRLLEKRFPERDVRSGLSVRTGLHPALQRLANQVMESALKEAEEKELQITQGALVALDCETGDILAMVGGRSFAESQFNRASQARRQAGSAFKPFLYYTAFKLGWRPETVFYDWPVEFWVETGEIYAPQNITERYHGPVTLREALVRSINVVAVKLADAVGPERVAETARKAGIRSPLRPVLTIPLGTNEVSPLEMAAAFCTFANLGVRVEPRYFREVRTTEGEVLLRVPVRRTPALDPEITWMVVQVLQEVVQRGSGWRANPGYPVAGKTGTTSDYRDAWFVGFTPRISVAVWFGNDDNTPTAEVQGGRLPATTWRAFMEGAREYYPPQDFLPPVL